ncbi:MAG: HD domain-containing protein [Planctomycetes bacterium]|nr:HD domain-containing protein [Planctomycetota bacterium]
MTLEQDTKTMVRFSDIFKKKQPEPDKNKPQKKSEPPRKQTPLRPDNESVRITSLGKRAPRPNLLKKIKIGPDSSKPDEIPSTDQPRITPLPRPERASLAGLRIDSAARPPEEKKSSAVNLSQALKSKEQNQSQRAGKLYRQMSELIKTLFKKAEAKQSFQDLNITPIIELVKEVINLIIIEDRSLLDLTYNDSKENYLFSHMPNVCVLSLEIGKEMNYNKSNLQELGLAALLHDIGMHSFMDTVLKPETLSPQVYEQVKQHVDDTRILLENFPDIQKIIAQTGHQHHERLSGDGYLGLKNESINEYAQIIGLADTFEAMTHPRPYRKKKTVQQTIRELLSVATSQFSKNILKILVKRIGIYPVGSWVELNTGEIGRVIKVNDRLPLRPIVNIFFDTHRKKTAETKVLNLVNNQNIYIKNTLDENELSL